MISGAQMYYNKISHDGLRKTRALPDISDKAIAEGKIKMGDGSYLQWIDEVGWMYR